MTFERFSRPRLFSEGRRKRLLNDALLRRINLRAAKIKTIIPILRAIACNTQTRGFHGLKISSYESLRIINPITH